MKLNIKGIISIIVLLILVGVIAYIVLLMAQPQEIKFTEFETYVANGEVEMIYVERYNTKIKMKDSALLPSDFPNRADFTFINPGYVPIRDLISQNNEKVRGYQDYLTAYKANGNSDTGIDASLLAYKQYAKLQQIEMNFLDPNSGSFLSNMLPVIALVVLIIFAFIMFRNANGGKSAMNFSKSKARLSSNVKVRFNDVAGAEEEKTELVEIVEFLKNPRKFEKVGARIPKGVLLVGSPGTGKTLFAKAVAGEANVPFFSISGSDFVEMYVGVGASRVRDLFDDAKRNMPCIVFIDEIDAVGRKRGTGMGGGHDEREQTLNQLLVQMDGFEPNSGIIVMAATNRADVLDPALLRPGRFDRQIKILLPDVRGREEIFKVHSRNKPLSPEVDFKVLGRMTSGFSGADIENVLNESAILTARDNRNVITTYDIETAVYKVMMGPQKKSRVVTESDKRIKAYHEAGHAIVGSCLAKCHPVQEVSIIPRSKSEGHTLSLPTNDNELDTLQELLDDIAMTMGGRAAEEIVIKDFSVGAVGDIRHVTAVARKMVTEWGMSQEIGTICLVNESKEFVNEYSEVMAAKIDAEIQKIVDGGLQTARKILGEKREVMDKMARLLIEKETIYAEEVKALLEGKDIKLIEQEMDARLSKKAESVKQAFSSTAKENN